MENENISNAIAAHGAWKERLVGAIESGTSDFDPDVVKQPDKCEFGKWLYGDDISADAKSSDFYQKSVDLHAQFHVEAGRVLSLALQGNKDEAEKLIGPDSAFTEISSTLTDLLNEWKTA